MGFDNECILNIQSLPGEYFCPVCRTLIYPSEALQTQCTHLYCKPCLAYTVATTQACPYDGYLVTEADSKPLIESNKSLAETIGQVTVHCLYHKSGCQWRGKLSDCITHGTTCAYGNSPVVCNRCGTQIVHRQVQEHAQLCPGLQPQTQQADNSLTQSSAATAQAVSQDLSAVASVAPAAVATTVPSATTARAVTASAVATSSAVATTASTMAVSPFLAPIASSQGQAVAPQTPTAEQYQQQLQYQQYYQQHYPGYNPYMQQYQQYGQYQQYTQPQMQVAPQNVAQAPSQPAPYVQPQVLQPSQPQHVLPSQPQNQPQFPQLQAPVVQPAPQQNPQLQSAPQISQMQPQSQTPLQLPHPQAQPMSHPPAPAQVVSQPFAMPAAQATAPQVQPYVQTHPPQHQQVVAQQQHPQLQHLPQQQHCQPQIQLNSQIQHQHPQVQQQSYPQLQAYHQPHPMPHAQPHNPSGHAIMGHQSFQQPQPAHQMPQGAPLQHPVHVSHQQVVGPQHSALVRPPQGQFPLQGQQSAMLAPQGTQHTAQHQQHVHAQRPPIQLSIPSQAPQHGFPLNTIVPSQTGQSYQEGMPSSQQQMHSQPLQPHVPPYMQQHHVQTSAGRSMSYVAPPQQFQNQPSGPLKDLHGTGQPIGQGSLALETHASESGKSENATNATGNTEVSDNKNGGVESTARKFMMSQSLSDKNVNREQNDFGNVRKDAAQTSIALDGADGPDNVKGKGEFAGRESNLHGPDVQGDKESKASDTSHDLEKGGSLQQSQQNLGALGSYVSPGMGPQHPSGPDRMLPQHMLHPGSMPYIQGQPNLRPPKHNFPENIRPPMQQQPYDSYHSEMASRALAPNQNQMPIPQPAIIRPNDGMIRPPMGGPLPGQHDTAVPPFAPKHVAQPHPLGTAKSNGFGGGPLGTSRAFHEEGFNSSREQFRSFAAYPDRHNVSHKDIEENRKQFPMPARLDGEGLQRGSRPFEGGIGRSDGFADSLPGRPPLPNQPGPYPIGFPEDFARKPHSTVGRPDFVSPGVEFGHHRIDGMPTLRNPGPFLQGMTGGPGGLRKDQLGSGNLPGIVQHDFDSPEFPHTRLHPGDTFVPRNVHGGGEPHGHGQLHGIEPSGYHGHMHPDDPNLVIDYSQHGFPKESGYFGSGGHLRNGDVGWCRICKFNCGSAEGLDLHVQTREHQQYAMDIVLKMKHDVAKRQKMNSGGPKSSNKKVGGKGNFRGNRR